MKPLVPYTVFPHIPAILSPSPLVNIPISTPYMSQLRDTACSVAEQALALIDLRCVWGVCRGKGGGAEEPPGKVDGATTGAGVAIQRDYR